MKPAAVISSFRQDVFASMGAGHLHHERAFDVALRFAWEVFRNEPAPMLGDTGDCPLASR